VTATSAAAFPRGERTEDAAGCQCQDQDPDQLPGRPWCFLEGFEQEMTPEVWEVTLDTSHGSGVCQGTLWTRRWDDFLT
jgi:hypothetical protein